MHTSPAETPPVNIARLLQNSRGSHPGARKDAVSDIKGLLLNHKDAQDLSTEDVAALYQALRTAAKSNYGDVYEQMDALHAAAYVIANPRPEIGNARVVDLFEDVFAIGAEGTPDFFNKSYMQLNAYRMALLPMGKRNPQLDDKYYRDATFHLTDMIKRMSLPGKDLDRKEVESPIAYLTTTVAGDLLSIDKPVATKEQADTVADSLLKITTMKGAHIFFTDDIATHATKALGKIYSRNKDQAPEDRLLSDTRMQQTETRLHHLAVTDHGMRGNWALHSVAKTAEDADDMIGMRMEKMGLYADDEPTLLNRWRDAKRMIFHNGGLSRKEKERLAGFAHTVTEMANKKPGFVTESGYDGAHLAISPRIGAQHKHVSKIISANPQAQVASFYFLEDPEPDDAGMLLQHLKRPIDIAGAEAAYADQYTAFLNQTKARKPLLAIPTP